MLPVHVSVHVITSTTPKVNQQGECYTCKPSAAQAIPTSKLQQPPNTPPNTRHTDRHDNNYHFHRQTCTTRPNGTRKTLVPGPVKREQPTTPPPKARTSSPTHVPPPPPRLPRPTVPTPNHNTRTLATMAPVSPLGPIKRHPRPENHRVVRNDVKRLGWKI